MGILDGVNGGTPIKGNYQTSQSKGNENSFTANVDYGFKADDIGDTIEVSTSKPAFNSYDIDQMWAMARITKPDSIKPLEQTMAFAGEGAEYEVEYSEDDMRLARFMFENMQV